jgi:tRNA uridine 5-carboxymethylaminomethyl modification enzyme
MFTSRAEYRLLLRIDNADLRLTEKGRAAGLVSDERWALFRERSARLARNQASLTAAAVRTDSGTIPAVQWLRQPHARVQELARLGVRIETDPSREAVDLATLETLVKYEGYLRRQQSEVERARRDERRRIPEGFPFARVPGLTREAVQRLEQVRPETLGQAQRIPGVTPAAVAVVGAFIGRLAAESVGS